VNAAPALWLQRLRWQVDLVSLRILGAVMLVVGAAAPHVPHNPGLPCPLRTLTGVPCPACGMTTSVKAVCTGHLRRAVSANPFGVVAVAVAVALWFRPKWRVANLPVVPLALGAFISWGWELHRFHVV
jgi:hypothetical protein